MKVGVVILNYNVAGSVIELASKMSMYAIINDVVVVDNGSKIEEQIKLQKFFSRNNNSKITFIQSENNDGYAKGNNIGLKYLVEKRNSDICIVCNPDIDISMDNMEKFISSFEGNNEYGVLTCAREYSDGEKIRQYWDLADYKGLLFECFSLYRKYQKRHNIYDISEDKEIIKIGVAPGAFWGVRATVLKQVGYMDEETFLYFEESCFARKILNINLNEGLVTKAKYTVHRDKASTIEVRKNGKGFKYLMDSKDFYYTKYLYNNHIGMLFWKGCMRFALIENFIKHNVIKKWWQ